VTSAALCFQPRPSARVRLLCLPASGGGATSYRLWPQALPEWIEPWAVQLPGHESRRGEPLHTRMAGLVSQLGDEVADLTDGAPYALFGHSLGGLIAYELSLRLTTLTGQAPEHLFVSAVGAPSRPRRSAALHGLDDAALVDAVQARYGGIPEVLRREPGLMALFIPPLRADLAVLETYPLRPDPAPCPVTVMRGADDTTVDAEDVAAWMAHGAASPPTVLPGGHFYVQAEREALGRLIGDALGP
jgi:surfactin synthase thioesterase subunit